MGGMKLTYNPDVMDNKHDTSQKINEADDYVRKVIPDRFLLAHFFLAIMFCNVHQATQKQ